MESLELLPRSIELEKSNQSLKEATAEEVIEWAFETFGKHLVMSTSCGAHSALLLHMANQVVPNIPVIFLDTGYLFKETYLFAEELREQMGLNLHVYTPKMTAAHQEAMYGKLWEQGQEAVNQYLAINKVEPMQRALKELDAHSWIAGLRADQTEHRSQLNRVDKQDGRYKVHPILNWNMQQVEDYIHKHNLPFHPLYAQGYRSIGDTHSTLPTTDEMDPRMGRILGQKNECGIHLPLNDQQNKSLKSSGL